MRILLWHGYLLGGTGSNVYTRALAREWTRAGHDVTVLSQEPHPERYDLGGAESSRPDVGGLLPVFVLDRYEGIRGRSSSRSALAPSSTTGWSGMRPRSASCCRPTWSSRITCSSAVPWVRRRVRASASRRTARSSSTRCAATPSSRPGGGRRSTGRRPSSSAPPTSARCWRTSSVTSTGCTRCRPASTSMNGGRGRATRRSPGCSRKRAATGRTRATRASACPTRATPNASPSSSPATQPTVVYFGKLLYNKGVHVLLEALRELDARAVIVGFGDYREELEELARPEHALHRSARAPAPRPSAGARRRHGRPLDLPGGVRDGRRRGRRRRLAAARRAPLRPRGDCGGARSRSTRRT